MLIKEYRICLPLTVEEYRIAQLYMIQKKSREESTGRESGVEIIKNEPYEDGPGGKGQYTFKIYHVGSHLPAWLRNILPPSALRVEEEAWNAYPYTRTIYRVPFVDKLTLDIETHYFDDGGNQDGVFDLSEEEKSARIVDFIDIVNDPIGRGEYKPEEDTTLYVSEATGRGPLNSTWREEFVHAQTVTHETWARSPTRTPDNRKADGPLAPLPKRIMCAYKLCRVEFRYWGMQKRVEQFIHDSALRKTMVRAHRQVWTWQDEWYGLTIQEIRRLEEETARALASKMSENAPDAQSPVDLTDNTDVKAIPTSALPSGAIPQSASSTFPESSAVPEQSVSGSRIRSASQTLSYDTDGVEERNLWRTLKTLEHNDSELMDYEPYGISDDDDTQSFVSCRSHLTGQTTYASAATSVTDGLHVIAGDEDLNTTNLRERRSVDLRSSDRVEKLVLIMVVHGGCLLDAGNDLVTKRNDVNTWRRTLETVIANHYPVLRNRVAVCLVPCPFGLEDTFRLLARLKTSPIDPKTPVEVQLSRDVIPLGSIPFFLTGSPKYAQMLDELVSRLNLRYAEFLRSPEGQNFHGTVCLMADSVGAILTHDLLNIVARQNDGALNDTNVDGVSLMDAGARRWRQPLPFGTWKEMDQASQETSSTTNETSTLVQSESNASDSPLLKRDSTMVRLCTLDFHVQCFVMLGSPVGLLLAFRNQTQNFTDPLHREEPLANSELRVAADQVCNLFHPTDPCSFRIEPILHPRFDQIAPVHVPQYAHYPLGDGQPTSLVETLVRQAKLFESDLSVQPSQTDGNHVSSANDRPATTGRNWEKATMVAFEALKKVRQHWWGQHRVDYCVHCPEGVQGLQACVRAPIFHASYWESGDVAAFVLRQLLDILGFNLPETSYAVDMDDEVAVSGLMDLTLSSRPGLADGANSLSPTGLGDSTASRTGSTSSHVSRFRLKRQGSEGAKNVKSNHRANDVVFGEGESQSLTARFVFGLLDLVSMANEKVTIQSRSLSGTWTTLGTEVTDSSGRIHYHVPEHRRFGVGLHPVLLTAESDREHPIQMTLAVVPPRTEAVVFSVDGSFAASLSIMGKDPKIRAGAVDVARYWQGLGYLIIYLSARPDMQQRRVTSWLANHNFPQAITLFVEGISTDPLRQKGQLLSNICQKVQLKIHCAYGSGKDVNMYRSFNIPIQNIFTVGRVSRSQAAQSTPITRGYAAHLAELTAGHPVSRPAVGGLASAVSVGHTPFDRPPVRISPRQSDGKSCSSGSSKYSMT